jgi:CheY-like chemotaxis protein
LATETPTVFADSTQVHQVLMNLGTNAAHAIGKRDGVIRITSDLYTVDTQARQAVPELAEGDYARVCVSDNGCGMDHAVLALVFEPFFTTKGPGHGTGLGLSVVHGIMTSHDGAVRVESEPGKGTTFSLFIPARTEARTGSAACQSEGVRGDGEHILYVDDEEALVFLATRMLERLGYRVTGYSDPRQALHDFRLRPGEFDAVVTDLAMPGLSGADLARELRTLRPDVPIVMISGYLRPEDADAARRLGVEDLIPKPESVEQIAEVLHRRLAEVREHRSDDVA